MRKSVSIPSISCEINQENISQDIKDKLGSVGTIQKVFMGTNLYQQYQEGGAIPLDQVSMIVITDDGLAFALGKNGHGQLGVGGNDKFINKPMKVQLPKGEIPIQVHFGSHSTYFLTQNHKIFSVGNNLSGQLGTGDEKDRNIPVEIALPENAKPQQLIGEDNFVFYIAEDGRLFASGRDSFERLDAIKYLHFNEELKKFDNEALNFPQEFPLPSKQTVGQLVLDHMHVYCLTQDNNLYIWGHEDFCPKKVEFPNNDHVDWMYVNRKNNIEFVMKSGMTFHIPEDFNLK